MRELKRSVARYRLELLGVKEINRHMGRFWRAILTPGDDLYEAAEKEEARRLRQRTRAEAARKEARA